ncbi:MAG: VOC family protein, partial [Casimicrobium sp.]
MFSHVTVGTNNLDRASAFYDAVLSRIGLHRRVVQPDGGPAAACWVSERATLPRFYVYSPFDRRTANAGN